MSLLVTNICELVSNDPEAGDGTPLGLLPDAAVVVESGRVAWVGPASAAPATDTAYDVSGRAVVPGFVDSHAHLVFAGDRAEEFAARMAGEPYAAGGIRSTVARTREASTEELRRLASIRRRDALRAGITHLELKSGYALDVPGEGRLC